MVHLQCWFWTPHVPSAAPNRVEQHCNQSFHTNKFASGALQLPFIRESRIKRLPCLAKKKALKGLDQQYHCKHLQEVDLVTVAVQKLAQPLAHHQLSEKTFSASLQQIHCG